jgi:hypothetical protein
MHLEVSFRAGMLASFTIGEPGVQGAVVFGMQGIGVNTPRAAVVAEATAGLAIEMHMPNGRIFTIGMKSIILAGDMPPTFAILVGKTTRLLGAMPKLHVSMAPLTTCLGMLIYSFPAGGFRDIRTGKRAFPFTSPHPYPDL